MKITRELLEEILAIAKDSYPNEFIALLSGKKDLIEELVFLPFMAGEMSAVIHLEMLPIGMKIHGTVHSHPSPCCEPSEEDFFLFTRYGKYHIIVCYPFSLKDWKCYNHKGEEIGLEVV